MKHIDSEDPRLTAYALGELPEHEAAVLRSLVEDDPACGLLWLRPMPLRV